METSVKDVMDMIRVTHTIAIDENEIHFDFVRSSGPGGQNVNKVSTAVQLRFDVARSPSLPDDVKLRLAHLAGKRISGEGVLMITARRHRTQQKNREDALGRLVELVRKAAFVPKTRRRTRPTRAAKERRLTDKRCRGDTKRRRTPPRSSDD